MDDKVQEKTDDKFWVLQSLLRSASQRLRVECNGKEDWIKL